ncbi:hypothetical protein LWI29_012125 [Acer saccharum]|uniref:Uncharacterized protein n=1 Tax=Acer saccharum TaxID=4024 RepID=A0AA39W0Y2_ACESA|nr:hypothetical protein LWI29_012125 [Acer saccharum]
MCQKKRRDSKACEKRKQQNSEPNNKLTWNIEDEVVKVLEKGIALGFNFYGRKKELLDIIAKRDEVNDNRFQDLVRRLQFLFAFLWFASCVAVLCCVLGVFAVLGPQQVYRPVNKQVQIISQDDTNGFTMHIETDSDADHVVHNCDNDQQDTRGMSQNVGTLNTEALVDNPDPKEVDNMQLLVLKE